MSIHHLLHYFVISLLCVEGTYGIHIRFLLDYPYKYYCQFDDSLQSVCLAKHESRGIGFFSYSATLTSEPYDTFTSETCLPTGASATSDGSVPVHRTGTWDALNTDCFPWPVEFPIRYAKVNGNGTSPGFFGVRFTPHEVARKFFHLVPVPSYTIPLGDAGDAVFESSNVGGVIWMAYLSLGEYSEKLKRHERKLIILQPYGDTFRVFEKIMNIGKGLVEDFRHRYSDRVEVFFFKMPTDTIQHAIMITTWFGSYMLYRTDHARARVHNPLPPYELLQNLPSYNEATARGEGSGDAPPTYVEATATEDSDVLRALTWMDNWHRERNVEND